MLASRKCFSLIILLTFASSMLVVSFRTQLVRADQSATILPEGIFPPTAPIVTIDNMTYTLTGDINGSLYVGKGNIVIDGQGHAINAGSLEYGIYLSGHDDLSGNNVTIKNTTLTGCAIGIYINDASNITIIRNNITANYDGINLYNNVNCTLISENSITENTAHGIYVQDSANNTIEENTVYNNQNGIVLEVSTGDSVLRNNVSSNNNLGIALIRSTYEKLSENIMVDNPRNFGIQGFYLETFNVVDSSNMVDGKPLYYLINMHDQTVPAEAGYVALVNCSRIRVENLSLTHNAQGIFLDFSTDCTVLKNRISDNQYGILLNEFCSNNTLCYNVITNNSESGIRLSDFSWLNFLYRNNLTNNVGGISLIRSSYNDIRENNVEQSTSYGIEPGGATVYNRIVHNNFINNTKQVFSMGDLVLLPNTWDAGYPLGGNYWSGYNGTDTQKGVYQNETGSDGMGDTPYIIDANNADNFPLMTPHVNSYGDLNGDRSVDIQDAIILAHAFGSQTGDNNWNPAADINLDGTVDVYDAIILVSHFGQNLP